MGKDNFLLSFHMVKVTWPYNWPIISFTICNFNILFFFTTECDLRLATQARIENVTKFEVVKHPKAIFWKWLIWRCNRLETCFFKKYGNYELRKSEKSFPEKDGFSKQKFPRNLSEGYLPLNFTSWKLISAQNLLFRPLLILKLS